MYFFILVFSMKYFLSIILVLSIFSCKTNVETYQPEPTPNQTPSDISGLSFDGVDNNKDGEITFSEYYNIPFRNFIPAFGQTEAQVKKQFDIEDKNKDGVLDRNEYGQPHFIG